jgi:hypothetical protein
LADLLSELANYLAVHRDQIKVLLPKSDFQLRIGWSPLSPQESVAIPAELLAYLAELRVDLMLDGYAVEDSADHSSPETAGENSSR